MSKQAFQQTVAETRETYHVQQLDDGLTDRQVTEGLARYGLNQLAVEKTSKWRLLLRQFNNMIIYILMFSCVLTLLMGDRSDALIIGIVVIVNALIGYYQEANAQMHWNESKNCCRQKRLSIVTASVKIFLLKTLYREM